MRRNLYTSLLEWKSGQRRKPMLLQGARQVGKTWLINEFGSKEYKYFIYLNFEQNSNLNSLFKGEILPRTIIENIGLLLSKRINHEDTLICFDEIQLCPEALTSLKYFQEQTPEFHIIAAGSLLGVSVNKQSSFPVGKVNFLTLYPLCFEEYLYAISEDLMVNKLKNNAEFEALPEALHEKMMNHLKMYFYLGGMPEVIQDYILHMDIQAAREIQQDILKSYQRDFSKYSDSAQAIKVSELWKSIPYQLSKENKKFKYSDVKSKARANSYNQTIEWLKNAGLIYIIPQVRTSKIPIAGYADHSKFKLYTLDTGLLGALLKLTSDIILKPTALFSEYNGAFVENYVCGELIKSFGPEVYYWSSDREAEVDFLFQLENDIYPVEVKSGLDRNTKSLRSYSEKYHPKLLIRSSPRNYDFQSSFINIPLYGLMGLQFILPSILKKKKQD